MKDNGQSCNSTSTDIVTKDVWKVNVIWQWLVASDMISMGAQFYLFSASMRFGLTYGSFDAIFETILCYFADHSCVLCFVV